MDEAEARRKRLKALREEVQGPQQAYGGLEKLANPLVDAPAANHSPSSFSFYSDPVGALKASRASTSTQPKQAPTPRPASMPPGLHMGSGQSFTEQHASSSALPIPPYGHHQSMPGPHAMSRPRMHMQWQQGVAAQQGFPGMEPQWHRGPGRPPPVMQHRPPPRPPEPWGHPPRAPHPPPMGRVEDPAGQGRGRPGAGRGPGQSGGSNSSRGRGRQQSGRGRGREGAFDVEAYYQPNMLEDPWQHLRQQQQQHPPNAAAQLSSTHQRVADGADSKSNIEGATDRPWH